MNRSISNVVIAVLTLINWSMLAPAHAGAPPEISSPAAKGNLERLLQTRSCKGCDLTKLDFTRMDLSGVDLEGADLSYAKLYLANFSGANLRNSKLTGVDFGGADLGKADLRGAELQGASFDGAYLGETLLDNKTTVAKPAGPNGADRGEEKPAVADPVPQPQPTAKTVSTVAPQANVEQPASTPPAEQRVEDPVVVEAAEPDKVAELDPEESLPAPPPAKEAATVDEEKPGAEEGKAVGSQPAAADEPAIKGEQGEQQPAAEDKDTVKKANLERLLEENKCYGCDLAGLDLSGKDLEEADLEQADLSGCNLEKADLDEANLKGAVLRHANLRKASLKKADLYKADLTGADLTDANIKGAMLDEANTSETVGFSGASTTSKE